MRIAIDIMGSDHGPATVTRGALHALAELPDVTLICVGDTTVIASEVKAAGADASRVETVEALDVIGMDEHPVEALRKKPGASLVRAIQLVAEKRADAIISAGSTGAQVAASTLMLGLLPGVRRAGLATVLPTAKGKAALIDVGANVNCKPLHLYQYGVMCSLFAEAVLGIARPRVALLSVGAERTKGSPLVKEASELLEASSLNFTGYCEGHEIFFHKADVVVCDGFVGNVVLKVAEGIFELMMEVTMRAAAENGAAQNEALGRTLKTVKQRMDWTEVGGAQLVGVNGVSIIAHGRSRENAIAGAVRTAAKLVKANIGQRIVDTLGAVPAGAQGE